MTKMGFSLNNAWKQSLALDIDILPIFGAFGSIPLIIIYKEI